MPRKNNAFRRKWPVCNAGVICVCWFTRSKISPATMNWRYSGREYWSSWPPYEKRTIGILIDNSFLNGRKTKVYVNRINKNSFMQELRHKNYRYSTSTKTAPQQKTFYFMNCVSFNSRVTFIVKVVLSSILVPTFYRYLQVLRDCLRTLLTLTL